MLDRILQMLAPGMEIVSALISSRDDAVERRDEVAREDVVRALRRVYFTPDGIRSILRELAEDRVPSRDQVEQVLTSFNDVEWRVRDALWGLRFERLVERRGLSLRAAEQLNQLRYGKIDLRTQLQDALNSPLTKGEKIEPALAKELLVKVEALNALILALEEEHNHRAGAH